ncbi:hypothetical protein P168DRAFT_279397 [Aspergillus campestris IBT 28561]|uniref:C3H1-type domain-containing protein n=1 Tax=Aspergillus campestris (strain IBT 28561) TaxID=1392248 RepID=A0A2I1DC11_ASPC2|nr:uncharacterized protein P168DRAFT_279397 [Aspergillus campestris IBT 28561]PKY07425.1 hypothetical protein P168DRAFT_279397 [Aspergillus campestris IBT 28561]
MAAPLRPQFFCTRPNGTLTPVIAVDELPTGITIRGVPRVLSASETQGMTSLGTVSPRSQTYVVEDISPALTRASIPSTAAHRSRDGDLQSSLMRLITDENVSAAQRQAVNALLQHGIAQNWFMTNTPTSGWLVPNGGGGSGGNSKQGVHYNAKKEYCSYWIRHGECDYQQQGCLYKHEMPTDPLTLEKLGLRDIPRWYREKYGMPSILPNGQPNTRAHWKDTPPDHNALRSIQYPSRLELSPVVDSNEANKNAKQTTSTYTRAQQQSVVLPGPSQPVYSNSPQVPGAAKPGKHTPGPQSAGNKKFDLLSFDPLAEYPPLDPMSGNVSGFAYPPSTENIDYEGLKDTQRDGLIRNFKTLMPPSMAQNAGYPPSYLEAAPGQPRSKRGPKSRRLYQTRSQNTMSEPSSGKAETDSIKAYQAQATASSSAASTIRKGTPSSQLGSPFTGSMREDVASSEPPTRIGSPDLPPGTSLSSGTSPRELRVPVREKEMRPFPPAIGSKKDHQRKSPGSSSDDDFFNFGMGMGIGNGN